ncbi:MAG: hypothetical protein U0325_15040 [Polyangiales bacterium]
MAQSPCLGCHRVVDTASVSCPACGRPNPTGGFLPRTVLGWLFVGSIALVALSCLGRLAANTGPRPVMQASPPVWSAPAPAATPPQPPAPTTVPAAAPAAAPAAPTAPATRWVYRESHDAMRNATTRLACLTANTTLDFAFPYQGGSTARICFRQGPRSGLDAWIDVDRGQFLCALDCALHAKFDDGPVRRFRGAGPDDVRADMVFFTDPRGFLAATRGAQRIIVEAGFFNEGLRQIVFENAGGLVWPAPRAAE